MMKIVVVLLLCLQISTICGNRHQNPHFRGGKVEMDDDLLNHYRIVGGEEASRNRFPFQVGLIFQFDSLPFCGGTLIHPEWVLTAGHCYGFADKVHIGRYDYNDDSEQFEEIEVEFQIRHPNYNPVNLNNDFALLKLQEPSSAPCIKIDDGSAEIKRGTDLTTIGWGTTTHGGSQSDVLREVELDFLPSAMCNIPYLFFPLGHIRPAMMCARRRGKDSCQGDSGGPLIMKGSDENGADDVQIGIVSWGVGCANKVFPGVYARVSSALDFIRENVPVMKIGRIT